MTRACFAMDGRRWIFKREISNEEEKSNDKEETRPEERAHIKVCTAVQDDGLA